MPATQVSRERELCLKTPASFCKAEVSTSEVHTLQHRRQKVPTDSTEFLEIFQQAALKLHFTMTSRFAAARAMPTPAPARSRAAEPDGRLTTRSLINKKWEKELISCFIYATFIPKSILNDFITI